MIFGTLNRLNWVTKFFEATDKLIQDQKLKCLGTSQKVLVIDPFTGGMQHLFKNDKKKKTRYKA